MCARGTVFSNSADGRYPRPVSRLSFRSKIRNTFFSNHVDAKELLDDTDDTSKLIFAFSILHYIFFYHYLEKMCETKKQIKGDVGMFSSKTS